MRLLAPTGRRCPSPKPPPASPTGSTPSLTRCSPKRLGTTTKARSPRSSCRSPPSTPGTGSTSSPARSQASGRPSGPAEPRPSPPRRNRSRSSANTAPPEHEHLHQSGLGVDPHVDRAESCPGNSLQALRRQAPATRSQMPQLLVATPRSVSKSLKTQSHENPTDSKFHVSGDSAVQRAESLVVPARTANQRYSASR